MITITTATGKTFESDYAVTASQIPIGFICIVNSDMATVKRVFSNREELPIEGYPQFSKVTGFIDTGRSIKLVLEP